MSTSGIYVYISEQGSRQIAVFRMSSEDGALTKIQDVAVSGTVMPMAVSPDRRFLYAALRSEPYSFASFAIDSQTGLLTHLGYTDAPDSIIYIRTDHTGRYLLSACNLPIGSRRTGLIALNPISPHGCVLSPSEVIRSSPKLHSIQADPSNRWVMAASCDGDAILRYAFDAVTGQINPEGLPPVLVLPKSGPRHFVFHPNKRFMYLVNEYDASVCTYRYDIHKGSLIEIQTSSALPPNFDINKHGRAADLHFTPNGKWLYVSVRASRTLAVFKVDPVTGMLTSTGHFETVNEPRGFNIEPLGRYLVAAGLLSNSLATYSIDSTTGQLAKLAEYPTGDGPNWVECVRL